MNKWRKTCYRLFAAVLSATLLCTSAFAASVTATTSVNVRVGPDNSSQVLCVMPQNATAEKIGVFGNWYEVKYQNTTGYVYKTYMTEGSATSTKTMYVTASSLRVRSAPNTSAAAIGSLKKGEAVQAITLSNGWYSIQWNGATGYVSAQYLTETAPSANTSTLYMVSDSVTVYAAPKTSAKKLGTLAKGQAATTTAYTNNWYTIKFNNTAGFVQAKDVSYTKPSTTTTRVYVTASALTVRASASSSGAVLGSLARGAAVDTYGLNNGWYTIKFNGQTAYISAQYTSKTKPSSTGFSDVPDGQYYSNAVSWAVKQGITNGTSATTFQPTKPCTRAEVVTFLWKAAGSPSVSGKNPFMDVNSSDYYYKAVLWAVKKGVTNGTSATTFSPNERCTRGQVVTLMWNWAGKPSTSNSISFTDVSSNAYYYKAVRWAVKNKVTSGTSATTFSPNKACTRADVVTFLYRYLA